MKQWLINMWEMGYVFGFRNPEHRKTCLWVGLHVGGPMKVIGLFHSKGCAWIGCYPLFIKVIWDKPQKEKHYENA